MSTYERTDEDRRKMTRRNDHSTSHEAADAVIPGLRDLQQRVYDTLLADGPLTDEELENNSNFADDDFGETTLSKRRTELYQLGHVRDSGQKRKNRRGRNMKLWEAVPYQPKPEPGNLF